MPEYLCTNCGRTFVRFNSLQRLCPLCQANKQLKPKKPMKRIGPVTRKWIDFRNEYIANHPPSKDGFYICGICGLPVHVNDVTLDHILPRSNRPDLRFDEDNIQFAHWLCNSEKSSKH